MANPILTRPASSIASYENETTGRDRMPEWIGDSPVLTRVEDQWRPLFDALHRFYESIPKGIAADHPAPNSRAIEASLNWLKYLRKCRQDLRPNLIIPDPNGGLIIERRSEDSDGCPVVEALTVFNDETAEYVLLINGKVVELSDVSFEPPVYSQR